MKKQNVRTLSLIVATITYLLIGAAIFDRFANTNTNTITYLLIGQKYLTVLQISIQITNIDTDKDTDINADTNTHMMIICSIESEEEQRQKEALTGAVRLRILKKLHVLIF